MKVEAVQCDARGCPSIEVPTDGASIPYDWLLVEIYQEGEGNLLGDGKVYCSWACVSDLAQGRSAPTKAKRKRRTRAQIEADEAAAALTQASRAEFEATERSMGVPPE